MLGGTGEWTSSGLQGKAHSKKKKEVTPIGYWGDSQYRMRLEAIRLMVVGVTGDIEGVDARSHTGGAGPAGARGNIRAGCVPAQNQPGGRAGGRASR